MDILSGQALPINSSRRKLSPQIFERELMAIADWWLNTAIDRDSGGFVGEVTSQAEPNCSANKGIILNTRILWFFSEVAQHTGKLAHLQAADRAFHYLCEHFVDKQHGGVFWELDYKGRCVNSRKQIYAQAFAIYAFSAYYTLTKSEVSLALAEGMFTLVEKNGRDRENGGYFEAFSQHWGALDDIRLSTKDLNSPKTMNTHLHIIEAYTALYAVHKNPIVGTALKRALDCYRQYFVNIEAQHLRMFLDMNWKDQSQAYSYGHDIESSWLIWEAVETIGDEALKNSFRPLVLCLAESCLEKGRAKDGSVLDIFDFKGQENINERIWWVQAEAMVGFINIYQMTKDDRYIAAVLDIWEFIQTQVIDGQYGEWHWLAKPDQDPHYKVYKAGFWKGPYHNGRAMLEMHRRLSSLVV